MTVVLDRKLKDLGFASGGYPVCPRCNRYEHHYPNLRQCENCGADLVVEAEQTLREFILRASFYGSGPLNTAFGLLCREAAARGGKEVWFTRDEWPGELREEYAEAKRLYNEGRERAVLNPDVYRYRRHKWRDDTFVSRHAHEWERFHIERDVEFTAFCWCGALKRRSGGIVDPYKERRRDRAEALK